MNVFNIAMNTIGVVFSLQVIGLGRPLLGGILLALNGGLLIYNCSKLDV